MAPHVPLARGWERQLDRKVNPLFYDGPADPGALPTPGCARSGVRYVALPDAPLDYSAARRGGARAQPAAVPARGLARRALAPVRGAGDAGLRAGGARVTRLGADALHLSPPGAGRDPRAGALDALLGARDAGAAASRAGRRLTRCDPARAPGRCALPPRFALRADPREPRAADRTTAVRCG